MWKLAGSLSVAAAFVMFNLSPAYAVHNEGPGLEEFPLITQTLEHVGVVSLWNTGEKLHLHVSPAEFMYLENIHIYVGAEEVPATKKGNLIPGKFNYKNESPESGAYVLVLDLEDDLGFSWGEPYADLRVQNIAVHVSMLKVDEDGSVVCGGGAAWAYSGEGSSTEVGLYDDEDFTDFEGVGKGWWFSYLLTHPNRGHFVDSPVGGLSFSTPTNAGKTDPSGAFDFFPGEWVRLAIGKYSIGSTVAAHKISPLDLFEMADSDDPEIINMARLLQSLDVDAEPKSGIVISSATVAVFEAAMARLGFDYLDFYNSEQIEEIIFESITLGYDAGLMLVAVSAEDAKANLDAALSATMFRKNVSKSPTLASSKAKLNVMGVWFPAMKANGEPVTIEYFDEDGAPIRTADTAKPLVITYTDAVETTGAHDIFAAVSLDDGNTWKRKNLSRMADRSSFTLASGYEYPGHSKKPVFQVKGNKILISWTSKFASGGKPRYAIQTCPELEPGCTVCNGYDDKEICGPDYIYDDPYYADDIWGVSGPQRSVDYTDQGFPEVGEVPYSAVWVARGIIATAGDLSKGVGDYVGDIVWFKPERLTSGRRDANQVFMGGADGAGFAISWQEDPGGLRPGEAKGPGPGWGGATTNHKTDIWYSYITWADFARADPNFASGGDPEHDDPDFVGRLKALVPMSLPVRLSDNDVVNTDNMWVELNANGLPVLDGDGNLIPMLNPDTSSDDSDGSHRYGYMLDGLWDWDGNLYYEGGTADGWVEGDGTLYNFTNQQGETKIVVITNDGRALDGNTGASRPNLFLQTYTMPDGITKSAWAIMAYEESKGVGLGPDEDAGDTGGDPLDDGSGYDPYVTFPDEGKNAIYHSFDFQNPDMVSAGTTINFPETDADGNLLYAVGAPCLGSDANGECIPNPDSGVELTDWKGVPILAYENARRPRFILQSKPAAFGGTRPDGSFVEPENTGTVLIVLYKEGEDGAGRPSDIMARRCVVKDPAGIIRKGNPWSPNNFLPHNEFDTRLGVQNVSTVTPQETWINEERDLDAKGDGVKVCSWDQPEANLLLKSGVNPYEDARAHRGQIRGDFVIMGYSYTPNWAASRNAHDKYDFYVRRSFNGGETWTTDPDATAPVEHIDVFIDPEGISGADLTETGEDASEATKHYEVYTSYAGGGIYEPARNVSLLKNNKVSVIEPRIVVVPGTIKDPMTKLWTGIAEDKQNRNVFYLAFGTSTNLTDVEKAPEDLYYSFSRDKGTTMFEDEWIVNPDSEGSNFGEIMTGWPYLAKGDPEQGEVQLRMTPDGSRFYSAWLQEIEPLDPEHPTHFEGSDIWFRRTMSMDFPANVGIPVLTE